LPAAVKCTEHTREPKRKVNPLIPKTELAKHLNKNKLTCVK